MFVGREDELKELKERFFSNNTEIICVLGRRRIGKSQLIYKSHEEFDGIVISYECSDTGYFDNLRGIEKLIQEKLNNKFLHFDKLEDALDFLYDKSKEQKILFIIDEYPYLRDGKKTDSEIKNAIDKFNKLDKNYPFKFILCGSSVKVMEILDDVNMPLHGRFNKIIHLFPLNYLESSLFYDEVSDEDKIKYYAVLGGVPYFLKQVNKELSFDENIIILFFSSNSLLRNELENQINGEINRIEKASYLLNIIESKTISYSDMLQIYKSSFPNGEIDYPLTKLIELRIIEKIFVEQNNGKKKPYYRIIDNSIAFYYSFINKRFANTILFSSEDYYNKFIKEKLCKEFIPTMFEKISFQFVALMNKANKLNLLDLYQYVINDKATSKSYQFDIVGKTKEGLINFECKFKDNNISRSEVYKESRQAELADRDFIDTIFISKSKVECDKKVYYLNDLFNKKLLN